MGEFQFRNELISPEMWRGELGGIGLEEQQQTPTEKEEAQWQKLLVGLWRERRDPLTDLHSCAQVQPTTTAKNELERRQKKYFFPSPFAAPWRSKHFFAF